MLTPLLMLGLGVIEISLIVILILTIIAAAVAVVMMRPKSNQDGPDIVLPEIEIPTADQSRQRPELFGQFMIAPNCIGFGYVREVEIIKEVGEGKNKIEQLTGYEIYASALYGICSGSYRLSGFDVNGIRKWYGLAYHEDAIYVQMNTTTDPERKGEGPEAEIIYYDGSQEDLGAEYVQKFGEGLVPYKGTSLIFFNDVYIGDNVRSFPPFEVVLQRYNFGINFGEAYENIYGDANGALIIYYILTDLLEINPNLIDRDSFLDVAQLLHYESLGISFVMGQADNAENWIADIERVLDIRLYIDTNTGKFKLKAIRDDYVFDELPIVDESMIYQFTLSSRTYADLPTTIEFKWTSRDTYKAVPFVMHNNALASMLGYKKAESVDITMCTLPGVAEEVIRRMSRKMFTPTPLCKFKMPDTLFRQLSSPSLNVGSVFRLKYSEFNLDKAFRILSINGAEDNKAEIELECMVDIFDVTNFALPPIDGGNFNPVNHQITENPQFIAVRDAIPEMSLEPAVIVLATKPLTQDARFYDILVNGRYVSEHVVCGTGQLTAQYNADPWVDEFVGFTVNNPVGLEAFTNSIGAWQRMARVMVIDSGGTNWEIVSVRSFVNNGNGTFTATGIIRGIAGTKVMNHAVNSRVWVLPLSGNSIQAVVALGAVSYASVAIGVRSVNSFSNGPISTTNYTYGNRAETPYGVTLLEGIRSSSDVTLTWMPRRRHGKCAYNNPDNYPVGNDDQEGTFIIRDEDGNEWASSVPTITITQPLTKEYTVYTTLSGRLSEGQIIEI